MSGSRSAAGRPEEELPVSLWENLAENVMGAGSIFPDPATNSNG
jgi:hypothetical protein